MRWRSICRRLLLWEHRASRSAPCLWLDCSHQLPLPSRAASRCCALVCHLHNLLLLLSCHHSSACSHTLGSGSTLRSTGRHASCSALEGGTYCRCHSRRCCCFGRLLPLLQDLGVLLK